MRLIWSVLLAILMTAACGLDEEELDRERSVQIEGRVREMLEGLARDLARSGPEAWLDYFVEGPEFYMVSDGRLIFPSIDEARTFVRQFDAEVSAMELSWADVRIDPLTPGLTLIAASYQEAITMKSGEVSRFGGYFSGVAARTEAGWRLRTLHWSSPPPASE